MRIYLNQEDKGEQFFHLDGLHPVFSPEALRTMGLVHISTMVTKKIDGIDYVSLHALQPQVMYQIDERQSVLYIDASPELFRTQQITQSFFNTPKDMQHVSDMSAYANYGVDFTHENGSNIGVINVPFSLAFHRGNISGFSNFHYSNVDGDGRFVRLVSALTRDDLESLTRLTLGDFPASTGIDGGGGIFGGINFSRNFSINPYYNRYTGLAVNGTVNTPSQVDYFLGDRLMFSQEVSPGQFEFQDVFPPTGAHHTRMVISDVYGTESVVDGDIYYASRMLKPGIHEFSYSAGFKRQGLGQVSADYGKPAVLGIHRTGISEWLTLGGHVEFSGEVFNIGGDASFLLPRLGEMGVRLSGSSGESTNGYAASVDYRYVTSFLSISTRFRALSRDYSNLNLRPADDKTRYEWQAGLGLNSRQWGSWTTSYSVRELHSGSRVNRTTLYFSKRLGRFASLVARYTRISGSIKDDEFFLSLGRPLGVSHFASIDYHKNNNASRLSARFSKNRPLGQGFGYFLKSDLQGGSKNANLFLEYAGPAGVYSAGYRIINGQSIYRAGMAGSVSWIGGGTHFSRPITDSFALVKVESLRDVEIHFNNQFMGRTNQNGELIVPRLNSYHGNRISLDDQDIPINYELAVFEQIAATPFRGGGIVSFVGRKLQAFTGRIYVDVSGERRPAEYWGLRYQLKGQQVETVVGKSGEFYLENLEPGSHQVEVFSGDRVCRFTLHIPESQEVFVNLGEMSCEFSN